MFQKLVPNLRIKIERERERESKSPHRFLKFLSLFLFFASFFLIVHASAFAATYYVDATNGSDSYDGISQTHSGSAGPWQSLSKLNTTTMSSGDSVLLKRGETWTAASGGQYINAQSGVTYADYGTGSLPIIDGNHVANGITGTSKNNITISNIEIRNGYDFGIQFVSSDSIAINDCIISGAGNDNINIFTGSTNITINRGTIYNPVARVAGAQITNIEISDGGSNITVDGSELYGAPDAGISIHNHATTDPQGRTEIPTNVTIKNVYSHDNINTNCTASQICASGLQILAQDTTAATTITVSNSRFIGNDYGIRVYKKNSSTGYVHGNITFDQITSSNNGFYGYYIQGDNVTIQRSLFNGTVQQGYVLDSKNLLFYNNTEWSNNSTSKWMMYITGSRVDTVTARNNIYFANTNGAQVVGTAASASTNVTFNYNSYYYKSYAGNARWMWNGTAYTYANWLINSVQDANSLGPSSDPKFVNVAGSDFTLQASSPVINVGTNVGIAYNGSAPDMGAYEYVYAPATPSSLAQYKSDGTTTISAGGWTNETSAIFKFSMSSTNASDSLIPYVELKANATSFTNAMTSSGSVVAYSGTPVTGSVTVSGLADGTIYHWQASATNSAGIGPWVTKGGNPDFGVDTSAPSGGSVTYTDGNYTSASVALTASDGTDSSSGVNTSTRTVQRKSATLSNATCGSYGSFTTITPTGSYPSFTDSTVSSGNCYQYQYLVTDNVGNQVTYTSTNTVKVNIPASTSGTSSTTSTSNPSASSCGDSAPTSSPDLFQINASDTQAILYFAPVTNSNKYYVAFGYTPGDQRFGVEVSKGSSTGVLSYTINLLSPNTTYYVRLRGGNGCMPGNWGNEMKLTTSKKGTTGGVSYYKNFISRILSIFPRQTTTVNSVVTTPAKPTTTNVCDYTVKKGDTLWSIAKLSLGNGNKYKEIIQKNNLQSSLIVSGQKLCL